MHHFIYAKKDAWISSGSNAATTGISERDQNYGQDPILEIRKNFYNTSFDYQTRALVHFDLTELSQSIQTGLIPSPAGEKNGKKTKYYLRLYEAEGNQELSTDYKLVAHPLSQSWDEGVGKFGDNPKTTNGVSWKNRTNKPNVTAITWSNADGTSAHGGYFNSTHAASQSFSYQSPDIEMDVTDIVNLWLVSSSALPNYGFLIKFSGSQETDSETFGELKFFSAQTHTIYPPKLEVRWDDHSPATGSSTASLNELTMSGLVDNYLYMKGLRQYYRESEKVKFRIGARERYIQRRFNTSVQTVTGSYVPEGKGFYSIQDISTGETMVPFSQYTSMSLDTESNYFIQWLNGFAPDRVYKILYKLKYDDGQEQIFDDNFEFIVRR
jgi:hypothetical protein